MNSWSTKRISQETAEWSRDNYHLKEKMGSHSVVIPESAPEAGDASENTELETEALLKRHNFFEFSPHVAINEL